MRHAQRKTCLFKELSNSEISLYRAALLCNSKGQHCHPGLGTWHLPPPPTHQSWTVHSPCCYIVATLPGFVTFVLSQVCGKVVCQYFRLGLAVLLETKGKSGVLNEKHHHKPPFQNRYWEQVYLIKEGEGKSWGTGVRP